MSEDTSFERLLALVEQSDAPFTVHAHAPTRTMDEARDNLAFDLARIIKTVAFRTRAGQLVLAALRGAQRVDYAKLAVLAGVNRRDLSPLSPDEVRELLGVAPGSVSPLPLVDGAVVFLDNDALTITPTAYCGFGRPDRTLEISPAELLRLSGGRAGAFAR